MDLEKAYNKIDNFCCSNHNTLQGNKVRYLNDREETIDMFSDYQENKDDDFCKDVYEMVEALETIKNLVDLQEELCCPLEKLIEFSKQETVYTIYGVHTNEIVLIDFSLNRIHITKNRDLNDVYTLYINDYKSTWWVKKDKSE